MEISIQIHDSDSTFLKRTKRVVKKNYSLGSATWLNSACFLAVYLYAADDLAACKNLLDSYIYNIHSRPDRRDLWGSNGDAVMFRDFLARKDGNIELAQNLSGKIQSDDIISERHEAHEEVFEEFVEEYGSRYQLAKEDTHKYQCQFFASLIYQSAYFQEMGVKLRVNPFQLSKVNFESVDNSLRNDLRKLVLG